MRFRRRMQLDSYFSGRTWTRWSTVRSNRSRPGEECRAGGTGEVGLHGGGDLGEHVAAVLAAGFDQGQQRLHDPAGA